MRSPASYGMGLVISTGLFTPPIDVAVPLHFDVVKGNLARQPRKRTVPIDGRPVDIRVRHTHAGRVRLRVLDYKKKDGFVFAYSYLLTPMPRGETTQIHSTGVPTLLGLIASFFWFVPLAIFGGPGFGPALRGNIIGIILLAIPVLLALARASAVQEERREVAEIIRLLASGDSAE
jgi:hypothetical protein